MHPRGSFNDPQPLTQELLTKTLCLGAGPQQNSYQGEPGQTKNCSRCNLEDIALLSCGKEVALPKGRFRTKNTIAMEIVVFCYRGSIPCCPFPH